MTGASVSGLVLFAISMTGTPGPNIVMLTASGAKFGFRRTLPHMAGVSVGFPLMVFSVGLGLGQILTLNPELRRIVQYLGMAYMLWLALRLAIAHRVAPSDKTQFGTAHRRVSPLTFFEALLFQWVNPKAWVTAAAAVGTFAGVTSGVWRSDIEISAVFLLVTLPIVVSWAGVGSRVGAFLRTEGQLRCFNIAMTSLLVASMATLLWKP